MKKISLLLVIFSLTFFLSGCINVNQYAVKELNEKAEKYIEKGEFDNAVARLESSLDLDDTVFQTHYNLAVAYMKIQRFQDADKELKKVIEMNPDFPDAYHSLAVLNADGAFMVIDSVDDDGNKRELNIDDYKAVCTALQNAIDNYNMYLSKNDKAKDKDAVNEQINFLNGELMKYNEQALIKTEEAENQD